MTKTEKALKAEVKKLRMALYIQHVLTVDLAEALHQHARTDCAPDEALPFMRKLEARAKSARKAWVEL